MSQLHETHLRVVSLRWTTNPNRPTSPAFSVPQVLQVENLSDPSRVQVVNRIQSFERMVIPYVLNYDEARTGGLVFRKPLLKPRQVPFDGQADTFMEVVDWPAPELFVWQATNDRLYYARAIDGMQVPLTSRSFSDVDLALSVTFQGMGPGLDYTIVVNSIVAIPIAG